MDLTWEGDIADTILACQGLVMAQIQDLGEHLVNVEKERDEALRQASLGMAPQYCASQDCFVYHWISYGEYNALERPDEVWLCNIHSDSHG